MELFLEIIIYLLVVLGLITVCFTFFNKVNLIDYINQSKLDIAVNNVDNNTYKRSKKDGEKIVMTIRYKNITEEEMEKVKDVLKEGQYDDIYDIVDKISYKEISSSKDNTKRNRLT